MAKRNRATLKEYFRQGEMPSEEHFSDLIDSMVNIVDEGAENTSENGLCVHPINNEGRLIGFFKKITDKLPLFSFNLAKTTDSLVISRSDEQDEDKEDITFCIDSKGRVGIGDEAKEYQVETTGMVGMAGRAGTFIRTVLPADGKWQNITNPLKGCWALEIVAACGNPKRNGFALAVGKVINCFGKRPVIDIKQSWYGSNCKKLMFRWLKLKEGNILQVKSRCDYHDDTKIKINVSKLWDQEIINTIGL
ncbi:MAG: hypothetical protein N4A49_14675 [Marinifilaceae bacterium]|jgi:hypothetical protein|nr:hypothetical protein [Marinifilaceae bacterium]